MRQALWFRAVVAICGLWFTAVSSDVAGAFTCPMHGNSAAMPGMSMASAAANQDAAQQHAPTTPSAHHSGCLCLGMGSCGAHAAVVPRATALVVASTVQQAAAVSWYAGVARLARAHVQPFANGPPDIA